MARAMNELFIFYHHRSFSVDQILWQLLA